MFFPNHIPHLRIEQPNHHFHNGKWKKLIGDFGKFYFGVFGKYSTGVDIYDFRRRVRPFQKEKIDVFTDGNDDYTYVLKSFLPMDNINYGQLVKIRDTYGKLIRMERRNIYGDLDEDDVDTVNVENFNGILRERVGRLVRKTKCFSKKKQRPYCAVILFQFYWNFMNEFRRNTSPAMLENLSESLRLWDDLFYAKLRHIN